MALKMNFHNFVWPDSCASLDISGMDQGFDGRVKCTQIIVSDEKGDACQVFKQGEEIHFFHEWLVLEEISVPCGGIVFHTAEGVVVHGKNSFQYFGSLPERVEPGSLIRFHQKVKLDVAAGHYWFSVGFASASPEEYRKYYENKISHEVFSPTRHVKLNDVSSFVVTYPSSGQLSHHGICDLPGGGNFDVIPFEGEKIAFPSNEGVNKSLNITLPTILHVTHWKAGSQWVNKILINLFSDRVVTPNLNQSQFLLSTIKPGGVYPTLYVTNEQMKRVHLPKNTKRFIVFRDLRDTLISGYFSMKFSHKEVANELSGLRMRLSHLNLEEALLYMMKEWLPSCANIQISWLNSGDPYLKYEDLLVDDVKILKKIFIDDFDLEISIDQIESAILDNRFENLTGGRERGSEDFSKHERKAIQGDWKNYFTPAIKKEFKLRYGAVLVQAGYERDLNW